MVAEAVTVVTGGASGIGLGLAIHAAQHGHRRVAVVDLDDSPLGDAVEQVRRAGAEEAVGMDCDVTDREAVLGLPARIAAALGQAELHVGLLCANAGVGPLVSGSGADSVLESTPRDWERMLGPNTMGLAWTFQAFVPSMIAGGSPARVLATCSCFSLFAGGG